MRDNEHRCGHPAPSHQPISFQHEVDFQEHTRTEHDVREGYAETLSGAARRPDWQRFTECPFGDGFAPPNDIKSGAVFSSKALQLHVAAHLKEISLLVLQKLPRDEDGDPKDMTSDVLLYVEGVSKLYI